MVIPERNKYSVLQVSADEFWVMRNTSVSTPGDGTVSNDDYFSLIPSFKEVHVVRLVSGVLICNCGRKHRFDLPCRHLFRIEASYDDKDIHHRLVNPQPNPTLETNVRNVLVALNGRAPYDKIMKMIESIRV